MPNSFRRIYKASRRWRRLSRRGKNMAVLGGARLAFQLGDRLSLERALRFSDRLGAGLYRLLRQPRRLALEHLAIAFGDALSPAACRHLARASFVNVARCFTELIKIDAIRARADSYIEIDGWEHTQAVLAHGKGGLVITGHIGNWELLAAYCAWRGLPVAAVARRVYVEGLNQLLVNFRARQGVETILRESPHSASQILKALKNNGLLAMLIDQDTHVPSVSVPFFGRLARTPVAAASLAIRRDLPVLAAFIQRRPEGGHRITIQPPLQINRSADQAADIRALTRQFNAVIEAQIRKNPAEWVWWHRRWRRPAMARLDIDRDFQYTSRKVVLRGRLGKEGQT